MFDFDPEQAREIKLQALRGVFLTEVTKWPAVNARLLEAVLLANLVLSRCCSWQCKVGVDDANHKVFSSAETDPQ